MSNCSLFASVEISFEFFDNSTTLHFSFSFHWTCVANLIRTSHAVSEEKFVKISNLLLMMGCECLWQWKNYIQFRRREQNCEQVVNSQNFHRSFFWQELHVEDKNRKNIPESEIKQALNSTTFIIIHRSFVKRKEKKTVNDPVDSSFS